MKIVEVINSLSYRGGAQVFFAQLCDQLAKINNEPIHVIVLYDKIDNSFISIKNTKNIIFHTIKKRGHFDFKSSKLLKKLLLNIKPDVVNYHLPFLASYFLAFGFKRMPWKLIKTYHSIPNKDTNRIELFFERKYVKKNLLSFVGISKTISKISNSIYPQARVETIYNGISFNGPYKHNTNSKYDFAIVASFSPVKNHRLLFDAFKDYLSLHPKSRLICIGDGELLERYVREVEENKLNENIIFVGQQDNVFEYLANSKSFVLSSLREGNPISILEALSVGLPVIAPRVGGIPDVIDNNVNGFLFEPNNKQQLFEAMNKINDTDLIDQISKNNIEISKNYSINNVAHQYLSYYESIAGKSFER